MCSPETAGLAKDYDCGWKPKWFSLREQDDVLTLKHHRTSSSLFSQSCFCSTTAMWCCVWPIPPSLAIEPCGSWIRGRPPTFPCSTAVGLRQCFVLSGVETQLDSRNWSTKIKIYHEIWNFRIFSGIIEIYRNRLEIWNFPDFFHVIQLYTAFKCVYNIAFVNLKTSCSGCGAITCASEGWSLDHLEVASTWA